LEPFFFGSPERALLGLYHPPTGPQRPEGVVICAPLFAEYFRSHGCLRRLATALAAKGFHVLRFDYYGTGDAAGDFESATPDHWEADIRAAIGELMAISGVRRVRTVGVRLGATLAARVALVDRAVERVITWDPVVDGARYVAQLRETQRRLRRAHRATLPEESDETAEDLVGQRTSRRAIERLEQISFPRWSDLRGAGKTGVLVLGHENFGYAELTRDAEAANVEVVRVDFDCDWTTYSEAVLFPHDIIAVLADRT
jgi:pimeloyl-ACP methyl ester carboxylesterase